MTKAAALALFERAKLSGEWEAAARALASVMPAPRLSRRDVASKAFKGLRLVKFMTCGRHTYNGAGCKVCPACTAERHAEAYAAQAGRPFLPSPKYGDPVDALGFALPPLDKAA